MPSRKKNTGKKATPPTPKEAGMSISDLSLRSRSINTTKRETPLPTTTENQKAELEIGTINLRLHIPGLVNLIIPVPAPADVPKTQYIHKMFEPFENKYWSKKEHFYQCLICEAHFVKIHTLEGHLAKHMGLHLARCTKCDQGFFSVGAAQSHVKRCDGKKATN